jgi:hypothetical protein
VKLNLRNCKHEVPVRIETMDTELKYNGLQGRGNVGLLLIKCRYGFAKLRHVPRGFSLDHNESDFEE